MFPLSPSERRITSIDCIKASKGTRQVRALFNPFFGMFQTFVETKQPKEFDAIHAEELSQQKMLTIIL